MTKLPVKVLLDENKKPFVPYMTTDTVFYGDTDKTVSETLDAAVKEVTDLSESVEELSKEVNAKIETVFTYKGNVSNYNALQQIVNPNVGDVYNTTDTDKNYAWSGTKWDDLGGIVDLSNYYTKNETDQAISDALKNVEVSVDLSDYYNKAQTDKAISDALADVEVEVDLSDYYNKTEVDTAISEAIPNIDPSMFLKQMGHVDSIDDLPSVGQPSGSVIDNYFADTNDRLDLTSVTLPDMQGYQYCFGFIDSSNSSNYCYVLTNYPEVIKSVGIANGYNYQVIIIEATSDKPAVLYNGHNSYTGPIYRTIQSDGGYNYYPYGSSNGYSTTKKTWLYGSVPNYRMFGVLGNHVIKYTNYAETGYYRKQQDNSGYPFGDLYDQNMVSKSYSNTPKNEGYIYNADMFFIKDAEDSNVAFVTSEAVAKVNDICTVGENNNIYLCVEGPRWLPLALPHDVYTKAEIDAMLGEIESVLDNILNGG